MRILLKEIRNGIVKVLPQNQDDLWLLSQIIFPEALVSAKTTRKIKLSETKVEKKVYYLTIKAEKVTYENEILRISGLVVSENDDIPKGSAHSFSININDDLKIEQRWLSYQLKKIDDSTKEKANILLVILDRESVFFAKLTQQGYKLLSQFEGDVQRKVEGLSAKGDFYSDVSVKLKEYQQRLSLDRIVVASPAFFKDDFIKQLKDDDLKKKIILATCSSVDENAFNELIKRDEVKQALINERVRDEMTLIERLFVEISKNGKCTYGFDHVKEIANAGAIEIMLVTTEFIMQYREQNKSKELDDLMNLVEQINGKVVVITSSNDAGKKLDGIAGIAGLLRYKI
jgi:protein pelota